MSNYTTGKLYENVACDYLIKNNLKLVTKNYYSKYGEIDLIMLDHTTLVFIEVRAKNSLTYGAPIESINHRKQMKLLQTAYNYIEKNDQYSKLQYRFDAVSIVYKNKNFFQSDLEYSKLESNISWYKNIISD